ncbi:hypothetical protein AAC387_Pa10g0799 [Persea americana]
MWPKEGRHPNDLDATYRLWTDGQKEHEGYDCEDLYGVCVSAYVTIDNENDELNAEVGEGMEDSLQRPMTNLISVFAKARKTRDRRRSSI